MNKKKLVTIILSITSLVLILSIFGITHFTIIEKITFGILTKQLSIQIIPYIIIIFIILFIIHLYQLKPQKNQETKKPKIVDIKS